MEPIFPPQPKSQAINKISNTKKSCGKIKQYITVWLEVGLPDKLQETQLNLNFKETIPLSKCMSQILYKMY